MTTRAPSASTIPSNTSPRQVTDTDTSAAGSRRVRNAVALPRRLSWVTWPSTQTSPSRDTHSAIFIATVRTGHGDSGLVGFTTGSAGADGGQPVLQHGQVGRPGRGRPLVRDQLGQLRLAERAQPAAQLRDGQLVVVRDRRVDGEIA